MPTPGIGDPYFYEWYVGLDNVIKMLSPDSGINCVIFQHSEYDAIDDVVVEYADDHKQLCYQVKHEINSSADNNLTFGNMLQSKNGKKCLFEAIYWGWKTATEKSDSIIKPVLFTNRKITGRRTSRIDNGTSYSAYSVDVFVAKMQAIDSNGGQIIICDETLQHQWNELCSILSKNSVDCTDFLSFLKHLTIKGGQMSLQEMKNSLVDSLADIFSCNTVIAWSLFSKLLVGLSKWATTEREDERVTIEDVYSVLGLEEDYDDSQHRLAPPYPFFESRKIFCDELFSKINNSSHKIIFLSGDPGSGKTSTISFLQSEYNLFLLRYHTFKPISPEQRFYNTDPGMCTPENLWGALLIQLRKIFTGKLFQNNVPISNKLLTVEKMREHVMRLLNILGHEAALQSQKIYICIDGIDHAARAKVAVTFLDSLPLPDEIPDGVCFVIAGQPTEIYYDQYPKWLSSSIGVERFDVPKLSVNDIAQLVHTRAKQFENVAEGIADLLFQKTGGNNLSTVFAVEEISSLNTVKEVVSKIQQGGITSDIHQYYNHIWAHMKSELTKIVSAAVFPESIVACPLLLMNGHVNTRILTNALQNRMTEIDWTMILDRLYPLVVKTDTAGEYALFHNDFCVFLMSIIQPYKAKYEEIALSLAEYLLQNDEGILSYVSGISLLQCANKQELIPKYFTPEFVINALAEGISKQRLDSYAHLAYDLSCDNQDYDGYCNTYLAIKTLYQHIQYYDYYEKAYKSNDYPEISSIDISEIRTLPLEKANLAEYISVLDLCWKLYSSDKEHFKERAIGLYNKWFGNLSPVSFVPLCHDEISEEDPWEIKSTAVGRILRQWGIIAAALNVTLPSINEELSRCELYAVLTFGEQYFKHCIENKKYGLAIGAIKAGIVAKHTFAEKLEDIYFDGTAHEFESLLTKVDQAAEKPSWNLLALSMKVTCDAEYLPDRAVIDSSPKVTHLYDEASFTLILKSFLLGRVEHDIDDDTLINHSDQFCQDIERSFEEIEQASFIARLAALLGKYYWDNSLKSNKLEGYAEWLLTASIQRPFDYSKAYKFLLYSLLQSQAVNVLGSSSNFIDALQKNLFEINLLGMYYKSYILDFLAAQKHFDIIKKYIHTLYGRKCSKISLKGNKADIHSRFRPYGELIDSDLVRQFTARLKWDVVGYTEYKEYAMHAPLDCFDTIAQTEPQRWQDYGASLYRQSRIADLCDNHASYEIRNCISKAAITCGLADYWKLRNWSDEFRLDPDQIYNSLFEFVKRANSFDDLKSIWILSCGIHSWYTQEEHFGAKAIYEACFEKAHELNVDFASFVFYTTPEWIRIIDYLSCSKDINGESLILATQKTDEVAAARAKYDELSIEESLDELAVISGRRYSINHFQIVFEKVLASEECVSKNLSVFLDRLCVYLHGKEWEFEQCKEIVTQLLSVLGQEAFWKLARTVSTQLSDYYYQTSSRNIQFLLNVYCSVFPDKMSNLFSYELHTQELWTTGNNHFEIDCTHINSTSPIAVIPQSLSEMVLYILLDQIATQNARKIEAATFALYILGKEYLSVMDTIAENWSTFSQIQTDYLLIVIERWIADGICTAKLRSYLLTMYSTCNELPRKYFLHSILLLADAPEIELKRISYDAPSQKITLLSNGIPDNNSCFENFFNLIELYDDDVNQIREHIFESSSLVNYAKDNYGRNVDIQIPVISAEIGMILYDRDKSEKWKDIPLNNKKSRLLSPEDPFILTEMPHMVFDEKWFPNIRYSNDGNNSVDFTISQLHDIACCRIEDGEIVLAASLWYPFGHSDGVVYTETSKISMSYGRPVSDRFDQCLGNYGLLACEGEIDETVHSRIYTGGRSLFNRVCGCLVIYYGNCQLAPSSVWRERFNCSPKRENPYVWVDQTGFEIMRFERIASPMRELIQEPYIRQPILFRWVCNRTWLYNILRENNMLLKSIYTEEPYPFQSDSEE